MPAEPLTQRARIRARAAAERAASRHYLAVVAAEARRLAGQLRPAAGGQKSRGPGIIGPMRPRGSS